MLGLGKERTRLGKWLDARGIKQNWLTMKAGLDKNTVRMICNEDDHVPSGTTMQKITKALREVDPSVQAHQFWDL